MTSSPTDCLHCTDAAECGRVCDRCPCLHCVTRRDTPDSEAWCLACVRWIGRLGGGVRAAIAQAARERGTTLRQARLDLLTAYHRHHQEDPDE